MGSSPLSSLRIRIVGGGALGLACGYIMRRAGHDPCHVRLSGRPLSEVAVTMQHGSQDGVRERYVPRMGQSAEVDATFYAVGPGQVSGARALWGRGAAPDVVVCSHPEPQPGANLILPLISAELCPNAGLGIVLAEGLELAQPADGDVLRLLQGVGFGPVRTVPLSRFTGRALQTAAAYVVLLALAETRLDAAQVSPGLILEVRNALGAALSAAGQAHCLADDADRSLATLAAYLAAASRDENTLFARNLAVLTGPERRKLHAHLAPFRAAWRGHAPRAEGAARTLIDHAFPQPAHA